MRILFDQGTPAPLRRELTGHNVTTAREIGWDKLENGGLLAAAEGEFEVFITTDQNLGYQQNLTGRKLAIIVLPTTSWPRIKRHAAIVVAAVNRAKPATILNLSSPTERPGDSRAGRGGNGDSPWA